MKKVFSLVLSVVMLISCFAFTASAKEFEVSEGKDLAIAIDDVTAKAGDEVTVKIQMKFAEGHSGITVHQFKINYPKDMLTIVEEDLENPVNAKFLNSALVSMASVVVNTPGIVEAGSMIMNNTVTAGDYFEMKFKVNEGAVGKADITFDTDTVLFEKTNADWSTSPVAIELINGSVTVVVDPVDVTFNANLEDVADPEAKTDIQPGTEIDLPVLDNTDSFRFLGWQVNGEGDILTGKYTVEADTALKGAWAEIKKYDVTFVTAYGTAPEAMTDVVENTEIKLEALEDTEDYTFGGWSDGEATYTDKYTVTGDVTLTAVWNEIIKYTVTYSESADAVTVVAGQSVTLPALENEDLSFLGWTAESSDEVLAAGAIYTPTASVLLTAKWGGAKKVYIAAAGADTNSGFTKEAPVATLKKAYEIVNTEGNTIEEIIVIGEVTYAFPTTNAADRDLGIDGKALTFKGINDDTVAPKLSFTNPEGAPAGRIYFKGELTFENITFNTSNAGEVPYATLTAKSVTINDGVKFLAKGNVTSLVGTDYTEPNPTAVDNVITINGTDFSASMVNFGAGYGGNTKTGKLKFVMNDGNVPVVKLNKGSAGDKKVDSKFAGIAEIEINGGTIGTEVGFHQGANFNGLGYLTVNSGTVKKIYTTGVNHSWASWNRTGSTEKVVPMPLNDVKGVFVYEINGGTIQAITRQADDAEKFNIYKKYLEDQGETVTATGYPDAFTNLTRIVIFNNGVEAIAVDDADAIVLDVTGAKLSADVTVAEDYTTTINGFSYEFPEAVLEADYNAVKVGNTIYRLDELENNLIPAPEAAGVYEVEFINAYKVTIGEVTTYVEEGDTISLERLPQNGELKHIGWATTEGATEATINHTTDYAPTADVSLYPVWAEAVYFTATFESAHGEVPAAISIIDDNEDNIADEAFTFPGYEGKQDEHFTFVGWIDKESEDDVLARIFSAGDTLVLEGNITFVARWREDPKATITYVDTQATAPEAVTDYVGEEIEVAAPGTVEGFEFLGWTDGQTVYQAGDKLTITADNVTLTAKWGVKVAVDANGAKGTAPVIGGEIGEEIDLPTEVALTYVNHRFVGFALAADGEVITGKYTVNPEDTLYVIWEEVVANAGIIETKVVYNSATNDYTVDMYFYGADANTVAFGYTYGENLEFVSFVPAKDLFVLDPSLETKEEGYYAYGVTDEVDGKIEAADATAGNGVHLGTITLSYKLTKDDYSDDDAADNIAITAPKSVVAHVSSDEYFLYVPAVTGLVVEGLPVVFDEAIEYEVVDVVYTVNGSVKVVRNDGTAPKNYAEIEVYNEQGNLYKTFTIEDAETKTVNGVFNYSIGLSAGEYTFVVKKTGYLDYSFDVEIAVQEGADQEGFVPTPVDVDLVTLVAGDVVEGKGIIDLLDFAGITQVFGTEYDALNDSVKIALDIDEDGSIGVFDLNYVKVNFGKKAE